MQFLALFKRALWRAFEDGCLETAKAAAFSSMLSLFPASMVVTALAIRYNVGDIVEDVSRGLGRLLPPEPYRLVTEYLFSQGAAASGLVTGAALVALWSASGVMLSLNHGIHRIYRLPHRRSLVKARLVAMGMVLLAGLPLVAATLLLFFGRQIENWLIAQWWTGEWWVIPVGRVARWIVAFATSVTVTGALYHVMPEKGQAWRLIWPGAILTTVLWFLATIGFAWYVNHVARYRLIYGSLSAVVVLLIWLYIVCLIVLVGCEFNAVRETAAERQP